MKEKIINCMLTLLCMLKNVICIIVAFTILICGMMLVICIGYFLLVLIIKLLILLHIQFLHLTVLIGIGLFVWGFKVCYKDVIQTKNSKIR